MQTFPPHPRSIRYEHEMVVMVAGTGLARELDEEFAGGLAEASRVRSASELRVPVSPLHAIIRRYFFNQL